MQLKYSMWSFRKIIGDKRLWVVVGLIAVIVALRLFGVGDLLSLEALRAHRMTLTDFVDRYLLVAAIGYVAVYVAAVAFSVPGATVLTLTGGFLFGPLRGTLLAVVGATVGATLVFIFARFLFGERAMERFGSQAQKLAEGIRRNAWSYLLALRLVPLFPFFLVNLVPAFVGVRLPVYVATTFVGIMPATAVFSLAGAGLGTIFDAGGTISIGTVLTPEIIAALLGLAALALIAIPVRNRFAGREGES